MDKRLYEVSGWLKEEKIDFAFLNSITNVFYMSGFSCRPYERLLGLLIFQDTDPILICPQMEVEQVKNSGWECNIISYTDNEDPWEMIHTSLVKRGVSQPKAFAIEKILLSHYRSEKLQSLFPSASVASIDDKMNSMRLIKNEKEIESMKEAVRLAEFGIEVGIKALKEGCTELEIIAYIEYEQKKKGIHEMSAPQFVLFGDNSGHPHGAPGLRKLSKGDLVMFDLGVKVDGYYSDITRTFAFNSITKQKQEMYDTVLAANLKAIESCKPGIRIAEIDEIARKVIVDAGYGEYYPHRVGHGLGLEGHEFPSMNQENKHLLAEGMTFTIEPGIYIPGIGGVRIEDDVLVTKDGPKLLTQYPKGLQILEDSRVES
ncbi:M24 family metallopeptidase [Metabacillus herbersteinensis]|uniref:M24 family metallopeptidase n=1 Tax=Metabacillus herbersteinensis TaxID=283816 RepID=A0ABV6GE79_9BACI